MKLTHHLIAIQNIKHEIREAMETIGIDCNGLPLWLYANELMNKNGFDPLTTGAPPVATTLDAKLEKIEDAKDYLAQAINECGGLVTEDTPFRDYPDQIKLCDGMAGINWSTVGGVSQAIRGAIYATDGYIYLLGSSKVWKTADLQTFTELSLVGTITGILGGICECSGKKIVIGDSGYVWIKPAGEDNIYKTAMQRPYGRGTTPFPIAGRHDSPVAWINGATLHNYGGVVRTMNIDTGQDNYGVFGLHPAILGGRALEPGIHSDDKDYERWVFTGNMFNTKGYYIRTLKFLWAYTGGTIQHIVSGEYGYANADMYAADTRLCKAPSGRIWAAGLSGSKMFGHYSDAHGLAFTQPYLTNIDADPTAITALRSNWLLVGSAGEVRRARNNFRSIEKVATVAGSPTAFLHLPDNKILCCTDSTSGTNLYITEA
jgi:hypothetical protein